MEANKTYQIKNRSASMVVYSIPEMGIRREFAPGETKKCTFEELEKLSYQAGGKAIMANFLQVLEEEVTDELGIAREPEYNLSEEQIKDLILKGSQDAFLDCLDFAPSGVIDLIKTFAVSLPMLDLNKREALKEKTGFDVTKAIEHMREEAAEDNSVKKEEKVRRVQTVETQRRVVPEYKIVK